VRRTLWYETEYDAKGFKGRRRPPCRERATALRPEAPRLGYDKYANTDTSVDGSVAGNGPDTIVFAIGEPINSNNAVVFLDASGELSAFVNQVSWTVHFILDVNGYFK
jgi:hypothetical protein